MNDEPATGSFRHDRWHIDQPPDDPRSTQLASAHESHHKQLQDSTSFGALVRVYHDLARSTGVARLRELADTLTGASRTVQESFATWLPAVALSWTRPELTVQYPSYALFYDLMSGLVAGIPSNYVAFHAAHAAARACMQTHVIESALDSGLPGFSLAHIRYRDLPDQRFRLLCRRRPDWSTALDELARRAAVDDPAGCGAVDAADGEDPHRRPVRLVCS